MPLAVRCEVIERFGLAFFGAALEIAISGGLWRGFICRKILSESYVALVILIELLTPGECPPRNKPLIVVSEGRVRAAVVSQPRPNRTVQQSMRLSLQVFVSRPREPRFLGKIGERAPDFLLDELISAISKLAVCLGREMKNHVRCVFGSLE